MRRPGGQAPRRKADVARSHGKLAGAHLKLDIANIVATDLNKVSIGNADLTMGGCIWWVWRVVERALLFDRVVEGLMMSVFDGLGHDAFLHSWGALGLN